MKVKLLLSVCFTFAVLLVSAVSVTPKTLTSPAKFEPTEEWQEYATLENVRIEYKRKTCLPANDREQNLILFRYTNLSSDVKTVSWVCLLYTSDAADE